MEKAKINIADEQDILELDTGLLEKIATASLEFGGCTRPLSVAFVAGERMAELNRRFLGKQGATDVIAFPYDEEDLLGEVVVNVERALEIAGNKEKAAGETALYLVHGILHLVGGYDDTTGEQGEDMRKAEDTILRRFGITVE